VSDIRIKTNIKDIDDNVALTELRKIRPKTFTYKDVYKRGDLPVYGFIAQEVSDIIPYSVKTTSSHIPNIYEPVRVDNDIIILDKTTTSVFERDLSGNPIKIKFYDDSDKEIIRTIEEIIDEKTFKVNAPLDVSVAFLYGQEVSDFNILEKDAIFTITTAAVQQIDREFQDSKQTIQELQSQLATVLARLSSAGIA
jgi:hypothetical protein